MSGAESSIIPTILDYLNEDCWWSVLQYVPLKDVILSERVSRRWETVVLEYLRHVRIGLMMEHPDHLKSIPLSNVCWVTLKEADCSFRMWTEKLGPSVIAAHCDTEQKFHIFGENCPNLEAVMFYELPATLLNQQYENFKWLHWLSINRCYNAPEKCFKRYLASIMMKELQIVCTMRLNGHSLASIKSTNLTSVGIRQCEELDFRLLLSAADRLGELTKLSLLDVSTETYNNIHLILEKMPKLDHLLIYIFSHNFREPIGKENFFKAVCRLTTLKHLSADLGATDEDLEAVTRCCQELRCLVMEYCHEVTGRGLAAVCRHAGARLTTLGITSSDHLTDDDVVSCVRACPNLERLDVRFTSRLTEDLFPRVRAARRALRPRTLRLYAHAAGLMDNKHVMDKSDGVTVRFDFAGVLFDLMDEDF